MSDFRLRRYIIHLVSSGAGGKATGEKLNEKHSKYTSSLSLLHLNNIKQKRLTSPVVKKFMNQATKLHATFVASQYVRPG
jgi:hypothetical protein